MLINISNPEELSSIPPCVFLFFFIVKIVPVIMENFGCLRKTSVAEGAKSRTMRSNHFPLPRPMSPAPSGLGGGNLRKVL
jgi:hypothetical protein